MRQKKPPKPKPNEARGILTATDTERALIRAAGSVALRGAGVKVRHSLACGEQSGRCYPAVILVLLRGPWALSAALSFANPAYHRSKRA